MVERFPRKTLGVHRRAKLALLTITILFRIQIIPNQPGNLTRISMSVGCQLGVYQFPVDRKLEAATIGWHQSDGFDVGLKFLEQFSRQTGSTIGVVSDGTINQVEL